MGRAQWGESPDFFGPRHAHREGRVLRALPAGAEPHLECAAGVGSLSLAIARSGRPVVAADASLRSLAVVAGRVRRAGLQGRVLPVVGDITRLPFRSGAFATETCAETLEHLDDDGAAVAELVRVLRPGGVLAGTVPAGPRQWSAWDDWAGHRRRYTRTAMERLLRGAGVDGRVRVWGWPVLRLYDGLFLKRVNRRRMAVDSTVEADPALRKVAGLGRRRWLVRLVGAAFSLDRLFDGTPWGVGLLFVARRPEAAPARGKVPRTPPRS